MRMPELKFKTDDGSDFPDWEEKMLGELFLFQRAEILTEIIAPQSNLSIILIHSMLIPCLITGYMDMPIITKLMAILLL